MTTKHDYLLFGATGPFEVVIGLEIHARITSKSKLFSRAATQSAAQPNSQVSFVDVALPGVLPTLNAFCIEQAVKTGLALNGTINQISVFERKNYYYPDNSFGYQISQHKKPLVSNGHVVIEHDDHGDHSHKTIAIERLHVEQDAAKSIHDLSPYDSFIDFNRAGAPLMEIVSQPDMRSPSEASLYAQKIHAILKCIGTCDGNMQDGSFRMDANVSVRRPGEDLGIRSEIKNLNSFNFLRKAIEYIARQHIDIIEAGKTVIQGTHLFDPTSGMTRPMRQKENADDYRYFPDPDLPPLHISADFIAQIAAHMPELPDNKRDRFMATFGLSKYDATLLTAEQEIADFFTTGVELLQRATMAQAAPQAETQAEAQAAPQAEAQTRVQQAVNQNMAQAEVQTTLQTPLAALIKMLINWMSGEMFAAINRTNTQFSEMKIKVGGLVDLLLLVERAVISHASAKEVFALMWESGEDPLLIVEKNGWRQLNDPALVKTAVQQVLQAEAQKVAEYHAGKSKLFAYFFGSVMRNLRGRGDPATVQNVLQQELDACQAQQ